MDLKLKEYQQEAYDNVVDYFNNGDRALVIFPTGAGKSFVALKLMQDNRDKKFVYIAPSHVIKTQMDQYIIDYLGNDETDKKIKEKEDAIKRKLNPQEKVKIILPGYKSILYQTLLSEKEEVQKLLEEHVPDYIIADEAHHAKMFEDGEEEDDELESKEDDEEWNYRNNIWGKKALEYIKKHKEAKVLGLTATPERTDGFNVALEFFQGKIAKEITLIQALENEEFEIKPPEYVYCDYSLIDELDEGDVQERIDQAKKINPENAKRLENAFDKLRRVASSGKGISDIFTENLTTEKAKKLGRDKGRYIIFCSSIEDMNEKMKEAPNWFKGVDSEPEIYSVHSKKTDIDNSREIHKFEKSNSDHIKLMFSVNMLSEGIHIKGLSGVVMTSKTDSRIRYLQQLGRALRSDNEEATPIVFDIANNWVTYQDTFIEIQEALKKRDTGDNEEEQDEIKQLLKIGITGITENLIELLRIKDPQYYLEKAEEIREWKLENGRIPRNKSKFKSKENNLYNDWCYIRDLIEEYKRVKNPKMKSVYLKRKGWSEEQFKELLKIVEQIKFSLIEVDSNTLIDVLKSLFEFERDYGTLPFSNRGPFNDFIRNKNGIPYRFESFLHDNDARILRGEGTILAEENLQFGSNVVTINLTDRCGAAHHSYIMPSEDFKHVFINPYETFYCWQRIKKIVRKCESITDEELKMNYLKKIGFTQNQYESMREIARNLDNKIIGCNYSYDYFMQSLEELKSWINECNKKPQIITGTKFYDNSTIIDSLRQKKRLEILEYEFNSVKEMKLKNDWDVIVGITRRYQSETNPERRKKILENFGLSENQYNSLYNLVKEIDPQESIEIEDGKYYLEFLKQYEQWIRLPQKEKSDKEEKNMQMKWKYVCSVISKYHKKANNNQRKNLLLEYGFTEEQYEQMIEIVRRIDKNVIEDGEYYVMAVNRIAEWKSVVRRLPGVYNGYNTEIRALHRDWKKLNQIIEEFENIDNNEDMQAELIKLEWTESQYNQIISMMNELQKETVLNADYYLEAASEIKKWKETYKSNPSRIGYDKYEIKLGKDLFDIQQIVFKKVEASSELGWNDEKIAQLIQILGIDLDYIAKKINKNQENPDDLDDPGDNL